MFSAPTMVTFMLTLLAALTPDGFILPGTLNA
jgi:hypothetical protein